MVKQYIAIFKESKKILFGSKFFRGALAEARIF